MGSIWGAHLAWGQWRSRRKPKPRLQTLWLFSYIRQFVSSFICMSIWLFACVLVCMPVCVRVCARVYARVYGCMSVCVFEWCLCVSVCTGISKRSSFSILSSVYQSIYVLCTSILPSICLHARSSASFYLCVCVLVLLLSHLQCSTRTL